MKKNHYMCIFAILLSIMSLNGCKKGFKRETGVIVNPNQTQLYIGNYDGDLGHAWLEEVAERYEAIHTDIQIVINNEKDLYGDSTLLTTMQDYNNDLYFLNGITYSNYVALNKLENITDVVTEKLEGEDRSIEDKMNETLKEYYKTDDGQYYAIPFFDAIFGTIYDVDLFEEEGFFFNTDGELFCDSANMTKSAGPNGIENDYDDGLPATFSQWKTLVDTMKLSGITPYTWTGKYEYYRQRFLTSIWADYEGKENFDLNLSLHGSYLFEGDSAATQINLENGYLLQNQKGKEYALTMAKYIIENGLHTADVFDSINTHTMAQEKYLLSVENPSANRIAMLLEGGWWENGAKDFFATMEKKYGEQYGFAKRKFGFMPVPKADDGSSSPTTTLISSTGNSVVCINAASTQKDLAKDFLQFVHSDESLRTFTRVTGSVRPYSYELTESDKEEMSYFSLSMFDIYHSDTTNISYITLFQDPVFISEPSFLGNTNWFWGANIKSSLYTDPLYEFSQDSSLTVADYVNGMKNKYSKTEWDKTLSKYFN